jgi:hypothetical protein
MLSEGRHCPLRATKSDALTGHQPILMISVHLDNCIDDMFLHENRENETNFTALSNVGLAT